MKTQRVLQILRDFESRNVTFLAPSGDWPIVWDRARGVYVWDPEGRRYLDLTAAFGVAAAGHANPRVVRAAQRQLQRLPHAMGDVHPHALKARLARELSRLTFERWTRSTPRGQRRTALTGKSIFCNSGFEAVEAALKTARLASGRPGIVAFEGAYHGLGYGALNVTHREYFRAPFRPQLREFAQFLRFPSSPRELRQLAADLRSRAKDTRIGAVLVEPMQARGGIRLPPPGFLPLLRRVCDRHGWLLILDEIYTGFGRTGTWFACEHARTVPDLICLGKALTGGFPLSACVGRADLMDAAWPPSPGEAMHTSTFLGNPVGCAMALAQIQELRQRALIPRSARLGRHLARRLFDLQQRFPQAVSVRNCGLLAGIELRRPDGTPASALALQVINRALQQGLILLPEGEHADTIALTPPLTITAAQLDRAVTQIGRLLQDALRDAGARATPRLPHLTRRPRP